MADSPFDHLFVSFQSALVGRYSLERELGRGGMGVVYLAREVQLDRPVAIKLLPPDLASESRLRDRFLREARTAARLSHPNIVPIHSVDAVGGFVYYVMMYVDGETLAQRVAKRGPLSPEEGARILREVAWALAYAHGQGVVHRDIKPANILLEKGTGRAMVTDFGIARLTQQGGGETAVGEVLGTPEYMSPEQATAEQVDGRSDLYSLGVVGYFALSGALPFTANTAQALIAQHVTKPAPSVQESARGVPRSIASAIDRCLQKDPAARFARGEDLAEALTPALDKREDVPVPIRVFLDRRRMLPVILIPLFSVTVVPAVVLAVTGATSITITGTLAIAFLGTLVAPLVIISSRLRRLMRLGYGPDDVAAGLRGLIARRREEFIYERGPTPGMVERVVRAVGVTGIAFFVGVEVARFTGIPLSRGIRAFAFLGIEFGVVFSVISRRWRLLRAGSSTWLKFWEGRGARWLAKLAGYRLGARAVAGDRPTEMAISSSAEAMFASLPAGTRKELGDVPAILRGLESQARAARGRMEQLDASMMEARSAGGHGSEARQAELIADLKMARAKAESRLSEVVTAMENVRLDLLRLNAGAGGTESITRVLEAAKAMGEEVDRMAGAREQVERVVRE